jgi:uncharacterized protein
MRIDVRELENGPLRVEGELLPDQLSLRPSEGRVLENPLVQVVAERHGRQVRLRGSLKVSLELGCARCLDAVRMQLSPEFDLFYQSNSGSNLSGEIALTEMDTEIGFFNGHFIDVVDIAREQILLALPMKPMCREDCKGLCPHCGGNRNVRDCGCQESEADPRLAPLIKIKSQMSQK